MTLVNSPPKFISFENNMPILRFSVQLINFKFSIFCRKRKTKAEKGQDKRKKHPDEFKTLVFRHFDKWIKAGKAPTEKEVSLFLKNLPKVYVGTAAVAHVDWMQIKNLVWNEAKKENKPKIKKEPKRRAGRPKKNKQGETTGPPGGPLGRKKCQIKAERKK